MNLAQAKEIITEAIRNNAKVLDLSSDVFGEKLSDSDITELLPEILKLEDLEFLSLNRNQLTTFDKKFIKLKNLLHLDLNENQLIEFDKKFADLTNLQGLYLRSNQLTSFDKEFGKLTNLYILNLMGNPLPFPEEILESSAQPRKILNFIVEYYKALEKGNLKPLNEAKLVVVGEANVGKTCVINRLIDEKFIQTNSTHGIEINRWENVELENGETVQLNVWDFGGQEIMHSTHQFFFTKRTIYILVINARENEDTNKTEEWLQRIQSLSQNSPVFIVGNKIDENNRGTNRTSLGYFDIERKRLLEKFPNLIKGFYGISSDTEKTQFNFLFDEFRNALILEIGKLEEIHRKFPLNWFDIKAQLEEMQVKKVPYITFQNYLNRCIKADIENEESQRTLIDFMHDLGIALSFQDDAELRDLAILNPEWVTRGVYALIDNAQITEEKGILKQKDIGKYLNENEYPKTTQDFIIKMMRKFRLLIDVDKDKYLIPDLLPKDESDTGSWNDTLHFQYNYDIYEKSILRRFMVEMFHLCSEEIYWRNGIVLNYCYRSPDGNLNDNPNDILDDTLDNKQGNNTVNRALVKADVQDKIISIKIDGNANTRREFIAIIRNKFDEIHKSFDGLSFKEMLGHPKYPEILRDHFRLKSMENDKIEMEYVEELRRSLSIKDWLNGFYSLDDQEKKGRDKEGNNIYIYGDNTKVIQGIHNSEITVQERIVDEISLKINDTQKQKIEALADEIISRIEAKELPKLNDKEISELEEVKTGKWETKLKFVIPLIPKIPFLENILPSVSFETTRTITSDEYISKIQKTLYGDNLQTNLLQSKEEAKGFLNE